MRGKVVPKLNNINNMRPVYNILIPGIRPKTNSFWLPYQRHSSSAECTRVESCSKSQKIQQVFYSALKKFFLVGVCRVFLSDIVSEVGFWPFWLMLPGLGPTARPKYFTLVFIAN